MLANDLKDQLKEVLHVRDLAERHPAGLNPVKEGRDYKSKCPFHGGTGKTPSFHIHADPLRGFHCFGCGRSGDVFTWLMEIDGMTFPEAVEYLAHLGGITLPRDWSRGEDNGEKDAGREKREQLWEVLETALSFYQKRLHDDTPGARAARAELATRQLPENLQALFGYAPDAWDGLVQHLTAAGYSVDRMTETGIVVRARESGRPLDLLRHRLIIPIYSRAGRVVSFAGRILEGATHRIPKPDDPPPGKYVNGRESLLFKKGNLLYGLDRAALMRGGSLPWVVAEGYFDVLSLQGVGVPAVGTMGTAMSLAQAKEIRRLTERVVAWFDPDAPGQNAIRENLPYLLAAGLRVDVMRRPMLGGGQKMDPDLVVRQKGAEATQAILSSPRALMEWTSWLIPFLAEKHHLARTKRQDQVALVQKVAEVLAEGFPHEPPSPLVMDALLAGFNGTLERGESRITASQVMGYVAAIRKNKASKDLQKHQETATREAPNVLIPQLSNLVWRAMIAMADGDVRGLESVRQVEPWLWERIANGGLVLEVLEHEGVPQSNTAKAVLREASIRRSKQLAEGDPATLGQLFHIMVKREVLQDQLADLNRRLEDPFEMAEPEQRERCLKERWRVQLELQSLGGGHLRRAIQDNQRA